jgi:hypothetical protein
VSFPDDRESGVFVCLDDRGDELRLHLDPSNGRWHAHRWRLADDFYTGEPAWIGPQAFGLSAAEWREAGEACRAIKTAG